MRLLIDTSRFYDIRQTVQRHVETIRYRLLSKHQAELSNWAIFNIESDNGMVVIVNCIQYPESLTRQQVG